MAQFKNILYFLTILIYFGATQAQHCVPGLVPNISVTSYNYIQWLEAENPNNCVISSYVINIFDLEDGSQLQFQTLSSVLQYDLSDLELCTTYSFEVHALTDGNVLGPSDRINATTSVPSYLNLTLDVDDILSTSNQVNLTWTPAAGIRKCITYYRVVYWDETNDPTDVYVSNNSFVLTSNLVPCMNYTFQVSAIITNPDIEGPLAEVHWDDYTAVPSPPTLVRLTTTNTTVNMTWRVNTYAENRCILSDLILNTMGPEAEENTSYFPIQDSSARPNVDVYLADLTPNVVYVGNVTLLNSAGYSHKVDVTFQTLDSFVFDYEKDLHYN